MSTATQAPPATIQPKATVNGQVAASATPPSPAPTPPAGGTGAPHRRGKRRPLLVAMTLLVLAAGAGYAWAEYAGIDVRAKVVDAWHRLTGSDVPEGFAMTNGRAEATKVYITTKYQGRIEAVLVREGDNIDVGQVLARMDTRTLKAQ